MDKAEFQNGAGLWCKPKHTRYETVSMGFAAPQHEQQTGMQKAHYKLPFSSTWEKILIFSGANS
jgi:hypothetical protein